MSAYEKLVFCSLLITEFIQFNKSMNIFIRASQRKSVVSPNQFAKCLSLATEWPKDIQSRNAWHSWHFTNLNEGDFWTPNLLGLHSIYAETNHQVGPFCETDTVCHSKWCPSSPTVPTVGQRENMQKHHTSPPLDDWGDYRCNRGWGATKPLIHLDPNLKQLIFFDGMGGSWDDVMMVGLSKPFPPENQRIFQIWWHYITLLFLQQEPDEFCWSHFFLKFSNIFAVIRSDSRWSPGMNVLPGVYLEAFPWSLGAVWIILAHAKRI